MDGYRLVDLIYENAFSSEADTVGFRLEGEAAISFPQGRMRMENLRDPAEGQSANFVYWCAEELAANVAISWDFWPIREPGLCVFFFAAIGIDGRDIFDPSLARRVGEYQQYHHGDINAFHISYFRHWAPEERAFHTCNLRKSYGFHMVAQGADPLPSVPEAEPPYHITLIKCDAEIALHINDLPILKWIDDGVTYGPPLNRGKIGFRQMAPLIAEYANLKVYAVAKTPAP